MFYVKNFYVKMISFVCYIFLKRDKIRFICNVINYLGLWRVNLVILVLGKESGVLDLKI